jgi:omega-6 fatty acid desaturase (delta-12 desaturase)
MEENQVTNNNTWQKAILKYTNPDLKRSIWQICNSLIPYIILWYLMYRSLEYSYWITILLGLIASGFLIRLFIIFHDCGHGSFFKSKKYNDLTGILIGILTFTPYHKWHRQHHIHHNTNGNLDKRGTGDIWTMTVDEYKRSSAWVKLAYRTFRNPLILLIMGPIYMILIQNRFTKKQMALNERLNVWLTNAGILFTGTLFSVFFGLKAYLSIQLPVIFIAHVIGIWLFYIQHQFEDVVWERTSEWDYKTAAIKGSSFLKLHPVLQWFTGNIGFHHIHHLSSRIPNYNLPVCHNENEMFRNVKPIAMFQAFKTLRLNLWDETNRRMTSFRNIVLNPSDCNMA